MQSSLADGRAVVTHIRIDINGVSKQGLLEKSLRATETAEDKTELKIYILADRTVKVDMGKGTTEIKNPEERELWFKVLAGMKVGHTLVRK